jgi:transketolase
MGVAEQNAVGVASGLIYAGFQPVFVTFAMFAMGLPWTQLRQAAYAGLPLTVIATHPGFDIGPDGGTHQMLEDIALARVIPEVVVLSPCDTPETEAAIRTALNLDRLTYVRVGRHPVRDVHRHVEIFPVGEAEVLREDGAKLLLIADGSMVATALRAADLLREQANPSTVLNVRTIKPLDEATLRARARKAMLTVTLENHSILGGLGGAVAEVLSEEGHRLLRIGSEDVFGETGSTEKLRRARGLDAQSVVKKILATMASSV